MKKRFTILIAALMLLTMISQPTRLWGQTRALTDVYELDGTKTGGTNAYATASDITQGTISWKVTGNTTTNPWRIGGNSISNTDRPIYSTDVIADNISQIVVSHGESSGSITVNSMTLIVSANSDFSNPVSTLTGSYSASGSTTFNRPDGKDWSNKYYKIVYNVTVSSSKNKYISFSGAVFKKTTYTLTYSATNGSIAGEDANENEVESGASIGVGETVTLTAEPAAGYSFSSWNDGNDNTTLSSTTDNPTTFTMGTSNVTVTANFTSSGKVATPHISPDGGTYNETKSIEISCDTDGATIHYTTDGSAPTSSSPTYSTAISVTTTNTTIKAIAVKDGLSDSEVASATYVIKAKTPTFTVSGGTYTTSQSVELQCETVGATIHYTTDGSTPTSGSATYSSAISVTQNTTIKAIAVKANWTDSDVAEAEYTIKVKTPTFSPVAGVYTSAQNVTLSCETSEVTIKYSTNNGETWNTYSSAIPVSATTTIKAKAEKTGLAESDVATATYTIVTIHNVAWALANIPTDGETTLDNAYISGTVSGIVTAYSSQHHNITYNMSDDGLTTSDQLQVYRGKGIGAADLSSEYDIMAGDVVVVNGNLIYYNQTTYEFQAGSGLAYIKPVIKKESVNLTAFNYSHGNGPSAAQSFTVRGRNLTENLLVSASSDYELCETSDGTYTSSLSLSTTNNTTKTIYVRLKSGLSIGAHNGTITMTSADAVTQTIDLSGSVSGYSVTYYPHGATGGSVPTDANTYAYNDKATVLGNTGSLVKTGYTFSHWTTDETGAGAPYVADDKITITANTSLYAQWTPETYSYSTSISGDDAEASVALKILDGDEWQDAGEKIECDATVKVVVTTSQNYYTYTLSSSDVSIDENGVFTMPAKAITITVTTRQLYSITYPGSYTNGSVTTAPESAYAGESVTIVTEPSTNYNLSGITCSDITPTIDGNNITFTMPAKNITISAISFTRIVYTVTYSVNDATNIVPSASVDAGNNIATLPTPNSGIPVGFTFDGWTKGDALSKLESPFTPTESVTLHAIFKRSETEKIPAYVCVSEGLSDYTGEYLIVYNNTYALDSHYGNIGTNTYATYVDISSYYSSNVIEYNNTTSALRITAKATDNGYSLYDEGTSDGAYLGNSSSATGSKLRWDNSFTKKQNEWTLGVNSIVSVYDNNYAIRWNNNSGSYRFAIYGTTGQQAVQLFRKQLVDNTVTKYYTRVLVSDLVADGDIEITTPVVVQNGKVLNMNGHALTSVNAANLVIEDGGILITKSSGVKATVKKNVTAAANWGNQDPEDPYTPNGWYFVASPVNGADFPAGSTTTQDIFQLDWANNRWLNLQILENSSLHNAGFQRGTGYLYASKAGNTLSVAGEIQPLSNSDNATITLTKAGWNLIGNPLTCKVTVNCAFSELVNGSAVTNKDAGSVINPCQGIAVYKSTEGSETVTFTKAESQAAAAPSNNNSLQMTLAKKVTSRGETSTKVVDNAIVSFNESKGMPKFNMLGGSAKLYIPQNDEEYSVVFSDKQGDLPLNFKADEIGAYTINFETNDRASLQGIYLIDILEQKEIDLSVNPSYTFIGSPADRMARFKIVFRNVNGDSTSDIFAYQSGNDIIVSGEGELQIFDVMGRMVKSQRVNGVQTINVNAQGVYIMKLNDKVQKIVVR